MRRAFRVYENLDMAENQSTQTPCRRGKKDIRFDNMKLGLYHNNSALPKGQSMLKGMTVSRSGVISSAMSAKPEKVKVFQFG